MLVIGIVNELDKVIRELGEANISRGLNTMRRWAVHLLWTSDWNDDYRDLAKT